MRKVKMSVAEKVLDIAQKEIDQQAVSQYERAFAMCDLFLQRFVDLLNGGMPRAEIVLYLMMIAGVERRIANQTLYKKLKKIGYKAKVEEDDEVIPSDDEPRVLKSEVSVEVGGSKPKQTAAAVAPKVAVVVPKPEIQPVAKPVTFSASADIDKPAKPLVVDPNDKWAHLRGGGVIGKGFIGEEEKWMTPEEIQADKERRARIEASSIKSAEMEKERKLKEQQLNNQNV